MKCSTGEATPCMSHQLLTVHEDTTDQHNQLGVTRERIKGVWDAAFTDTLAGHHGKRQGKLQCGPETAAPIHQW